MQGLELWDITAHRHRHSPESRAANRRLAPHKAGQRQAVLAAIRGAGPAGLTCAELAGIWQVGMNQISGRFSELKARGQITRTGRRGGGAVYIYSENSP